MNDLQQYIQLSADPERTLTESYNELLKEFYQLRTSVYLTESVDKEADDMIKKLEQQLTAAKKGLGLTNKLKGEQKAKHAKRVMGNLNRIRAQLKKLQSQLKSTKSGE